MTPNSTKYIQKAPSVSNEDYFYQTTLQANDRDY